MLLLLYPEAVRDNPAWMLFAAADGQSVVLLGELLVSASLSVKANKHLSF